MLNGKIELYLTEHRTLLQLMIEKIKTPAFEELEFTSKLLYIEGVRSYRKKVETKMFQPPRKKKIVLISVKMYQLKVMIDTVVYGSIVFGEYERNIIRSVNQSIDKQCVDFSHHLENSILQIQ